MARLNQPLPTHRQEREELEDALQVARHNNQRITAERDILANERDELLVRNARLNDQVAALLAGQLIN